MAVPQPEQGNPAPKSVAENIRETLESIVVAFILAFVFRAFIVEAFVIPTGSMAVTLYGDHATNTCSTCGYEYAVNVTEQMVRYRATSYSLCCPNCNSLTDQLNPPQIARPDSGDRILVHKWPFDIGGELLGPKRWDVTVFKDPRDGTTNFIKRLVGLPGEVLEIIDGDVYAVPAKSLTPELVAEIDALRRDVYAHRNDSSLGSRVDFIRRYAEVNRRLLPLLAIQRKHPSEGHDARAQQSLWFNVYNHDFLPNYGRLPARSTGGRVGWEPVDAASAAAWKTDQREITFAAQGDQPLSVRFAGKPIDDFYAYNNDGVPERGPGDRRLVGDIRLRFVWFPDAGDGGLTLAMNRDTDEFAAEMRLDGTVTLQAYLPGAGFPGDRLMVGQKKLEALRPGAAVEVEFINLDYRVYLFINGELVLATTDEQYRPRGEKLVRLVDAGIKGEDQSSELRPSQVQISARRLSGRLRHVVLERDVYYRSQKEPEPASPYHNWPGWGTAGFPILLRTAHVHEGRRYGAEYFMLGDNSPASKDSRLWWEIGPHLRSIGEEYQVGTVPEDQLIGKAFFVYWPAGHRATWAGGIGIIPNFGRMRWIR